MNRTRMLLLLAVLPLTACAVRFNPLPTHGTRHQTVVVDDDHHDHHKHKKHKKHKHH